MLENEDKVYKQNQPVTIIRGEILVDARTELSDIVREHIVPRLPEADSGEYAGTDNLHNIFQHFIDQRTAAIDTVTFYRTERELPLTYALLAEIVGQELGFEPRKQEDLVALGRDRDIYEAIRGVQDVMAALEEGLRQGLRNREIFDRRAAAACSDEFWKDRNVAELVARCVGVETVDLPYVLYAGGFISEGELHVFTNMKCILTDVPLGMR